jgi:hypothetical protein
MTTAPSADENHQAPAQLLEGSQAMHIRHSNKYRMKVNTL